MTSPDHHVPKEGYTVSSLPALQALNENTIRQQLRTPAISALEEIKTSISLNLLGGIAKAIRQGLQGIFTGGWFGQVNSAAVEIYDGQLAIDKRVDLIPTGYCSAYMTTNINLAWGSDNNRRAPFKGQVGPASGAHVDTERGGIIFDLPGTWLISALTNCRSTGYTGDNSVVMYVSVRRPDDSIYSEKHIYASPGTAGTSLSATQPVVIPEAGYYVNIWIWSGRWRWWDGGTRLSGLTVSRAAIGTNHPGDPTAPDETNPGN